MILSITLALSIFNPAHAENLLSTKTESGVAIQLRGKNLVQISAPIEMTASYGRKAILSEKLELDSDCDSVGLVVEQFSDGDALMAYCRVDSGPTLTFLANLVPPTCREGDLARGTKGKYVCRVNRVTCTYDYNPYTWQEVGVEVMDNNHGCN